MKYDCLKDCDWKSFSAKAGATLEPKQLVEGGKPLPAEVIAQLVRSGAIVAATEETPPLGK